MRARKVAGATVRAGLCVGAVVTFAAPAMAAAAEADRSGRILYAEPLRQLPAATGTASQKTSPTETQPLRFDAFGRRFEMSLRPNGRLMEQARVKAGPTSLQLYQGTLDGVAGSWVRLATKGSTLHGMMWDGTQLYAIEPAAEVRDALVPPLQPGDAETVVFRLADVIVDAASAACATDGSTTSGKADAAFDAIVQELKGAPLALQAAGATRRLDISVLGDWKFLQRYDNEGDARDAILTRLNNVDGIFSAELGIEVRVGNLAVNDVDSDPLSNATAPNALLSELARLRKRTPQLNSHGLTHLFTNRDLDGTTIGIAYLDSVCATEHAVGLTESRNVWLDSLVSAHEIGHNFGADHDGDAQGSCPNAPSSGYLMSPIVSGSDEFSQCSLNRMRARSQAASCITNLPAANVTIPASLGVARHAVSQPFTWQLAVRNSGGVSARGVRAELSVPAAIEVEDVNVVGGSCTSGAGAIDCQLGDIGGGNTRTIQLELRSEVIGSHSIAAQIVADNDSTTADNSGSGQIGIEMQADVAVTLQGPASATANETFSVGFQVENAAQESAGNVAVVIDIPSGTSISTAALSNGSCTTQSGRVQCTLGPLAAGASASGTLSLKALAAGSAALHAAVSGDYVDPNAANDTADLMITVGAAASVSTAGTATASPGGGGGGGSIGLLLLLALAPLRQARAFPRS
jgi:hypothetical protein